MTMELPSIGPHILLSMRVQDMTWLKAVGELIDNAFDANATNVKLQFGKKELTVRDNGHGCLDVVNMLTIGRHRRSTSTQLGMYGVGLKDAACWLWGTTYITSWKSKTKVSAVVNWERLSKQDKWYISDPVRQELQEASHGTILRFTDITRTAPEYDKLQRDLSYFFYPALKSGRQIEISFPKKSPLVCAAWTMPVMDQVVHDRFSVNGKAVELYAGLVPAGEMNSRAGFSFAFGHRIIANSSLGAKGMSTSRVCGIVTLDRSWSPGKNKTDLGEDDEQRQALEDAIFERCFHLFEQSQAQASIFENRQLELAVTNALRKALAKPTEKAKRLDGDSTGTVEPKATNRKHRRAKLTQPGDSFVSKFRSGQWRMEWKSRGDMCLGDVDVYGAVVYLNSDHPRLAYHRDNGNADALVDSCLALLSYQAIEQKEKFKLPFAREYDGFVEMYSSLMEGQVPCSEEKMVLATQP